MEMVSYNQKLLEHVLVDKVKAYLEKEAIKSIQEEIHQIAVDAVKDWAEIRFSKEANTFALHENINITFVERVIKTEMQNHPISITVKESS